ncbi:MAG: division/cell wall cluster transcriptional repressor MraZ [bacterium]|nr:division/cell wall cluster transcriptional repressor MraZ [bacterium]
MNTVHKLCFFNNSGKKWGKVVKSGKSLLIFAQILYLPVMTGLIGEYDCKVDAKGRFMFPIDLRKQLEALFEKGFVINRNLHQKCLVLYPMSEWEKLNKKLSKLNRLIKANDVFVRKFTGGATNVEADNSGRLLLPKSLGEYADIKSDLKVLGSNNVIEIWDKTMYEDFLSQDINIEKLAEDVLGGINFNDIGDE